MSIAYLDVLAVPASLHAAFLAQRDLQARTSPGLNSAAQVVLEAQLLRDGVCGKCIASQGGAVGSKGEVEVVGSDGADEFVRVAAIGMAERNKSE
ncbi:hypothetical protein IG631_07902 [Alternaria alternata]|nr:hypothetical protein IG631_07902 [Alternaria alternata]